MVKTSVVMATVGVALLANIGRADVTTFTMDDFTDQNAGWPVNATTDTTAVYESTLSGVLGGYRGHKMTHVTVATGSDSVSSNVDTTAGQLTYSSTAGASGWIDLTYGGDFAFLMHGILFSEPVVGGATMTLNFSSVTGVNGPNWLVINQSYYDAQHSSMYNPLPLNIKQNGAQAATFTFPANSGMTDLNAANFYISVPTGGSFTLGSIEFTTTVTPTPEPASLGMICVVPLLLRRRRVG